MNRAIISAATAALAVSLAGCVGEGPDPALVQADRDACHPIASLVERAECQNKVTAKYYGTSPDLNVLAAERVALADRETKGEIDHAEAQLEWAKAVADAADKDRQRRLEAAAVIAAAAPHTCTTSPIGASAVTTCN